MDKVYIDFVRSLENLVINRFIITQLRSKEIVRQNRRASLTIYRPARPIMQEMELQGMNQVWHAMSVIVPHDASQNMPLWPLCSPSA